MLILFFLENVLLNIYGVMDCVTDGVTDCVTDCVTDLTWYQKCPSILQGIQIMYVYTYINSQKLSAQISCGFKMCGQVGGRDAKIQKHPLGRQDLLKIILKVDLQISPNLRGLFTKKFKVLIFLGLFIFKRIFFIPKFDYKLSQLLARTFFDKIPIFTLPIY